jgi:DNA-binding CsgD family transcriptional regulator/catechol 2,3-dioxygenase-like lactoylglutathione lyase family enzyme
MNRRGRPPDTDVLTPAEWKVAEAVRHGLSNPRIAERLHISADAVKFHVANILHKLQLANRRELRVWNGIRAASVLSHHATSQHPNSASLVGIGQIARRVTDIRAAEAWYRDVLGLPHLYTLGAMSFFDCGGVRLMLAESTEISTESIIYFRVDNVHLTQRVLTERGIVFTHAPHLIHRHTDGTEEWMAFFNDNDARPLAIMCSVAPCDPPPVKRKDIP